MKLSYEFCISKIGFSSVHECSIWEYPNILNLLIKKGADIHVLDKEGNSPLHLANSLEITQELHSMKTVECSRILLENGAKTTVTNNDGNTPLHMLNVPIEKIKLLIEHKAPLEAVNNFQNTPLMEAVKYGSLAIHHFSLLQQSGDITSLAKLKNFFDQKGNSLLHNLIRGLEFETFEKLLNQETLFQVMKPLIDAPNAEGETPLHLACKEDWDDGVSLLISKGANWNQQNAFQKHTLDLVLENNSVQCLVLLLKKMDNETVGIWKEKILSHRDFHGNSLIHSAVSLKSLPCVESLLDFGFSPNNPLSDEHEYSDGGSPLHLGTSNSS